MEQQSIIASWGAAPGARASSLLRAMRPWQWLKNLLVFAPLIAGHSAVVGDWTSAVIAFAALSLAASGMYLVNDVVDVDHDRGHPSKRLRPHAAGQLSRRASLRMSAVLVLAASALALAVSTMLLWTLWIYCAAAMGYSLRLKQIPVVDVLLLTALFLLRVIVGGVAAGIEISVWMFAFLGALFLSLSLVKRCSELVQLRTRDFQDWSARPYHLDDLPFLQTAGMVCGIASTLVLTFYIGSPEAAALYSTPEWLWGVLAAQLFWVMKAWFLTLNGTMHDDPVIHAATHPGSVVLIMSCLACLTLAI